MSPPTVFTVKVKTASFLPLTSVVALAKYVVALFGKLDIFSTVTERPVLLVTVTPLISPVLDTNLTIVLT